VKLISFYSGKKLPTLLLINSYRIQKSKVIALLLFCFCKVIALLLCSLSKPITLPL
jgi:hypothetical protein